MPFDRRLAEFAQPVELPEQGLAFYRDHLGHEVIWRNDDLGQVGLRLPDAETELVLATRQDYEANWLVSSVADAVAAMVRGGGRVVTEERRIPVGRLAVVADPFGNQLVLLDLSAGTYVTGRDGRVVGVASPRHYRSPDEGDG